jgi:phage repressor protein C with HTH and peptisase S24 domain
MTDILITGCPIVNIGRLMFMRSNRERSGFGQRMYEARKRAGLTQKEVQAKLGISQSNMSDLEGMAESSSFTAQLASLYGCSPNWLATGEGSPEVIVIDGQHRLFSQLKDLDLSKAVIDSLHLDAFARATANAEDAGAPRVMRPTPVVGMAKLGDNGYYEELQFPAGHGDGWVDGYSVDPNAYALRVKGDSMHPAIRHGAFVVVEPNSVCMPGEYVAIALTDGRKMVKELIMERPDEIVVESVNGNQRQTIDRSMIEHIHPVAAVVAASKWRPA